MQTILGSGGAIATELAKALAAYTNEIRLVSRHPKKVNESDQLFVANLLNKEEVMKAVEGSEVVYATVGFEYNLKVWKESWPLFIENVIDACSHYGAKLVFFDNIYMYDKNHLNGMTEETPVNPPSKKGQIRAEIAQKIMEKVREGKLTALIARSADFYGPGIKDRSVLVETVFKPLSKGEKANYLGNVNCKHSFTYTPDAGKATALLGNSKEAYNQVWHLPTAPNPYTGKEWIEKIASSMGVKPRYRAAGGLMVSFLGLFVPVMREMKEMLYQNTTDYVFDSSKFEQAFKMIPTPYDQGIQEIVETDFNPKIRT